jgi:hypothetical protein
MGVSMIVLVPHEMRAYVRKGQLGEVDGEWWVEWMLNHDGSVGGRIVAILAIVALEHK